MIKIEPFGIMDFEQLISWVDSEETLIQFAGPIFTYPLTTKQLMQYMQDKNRYAYKVMDVLKDQTIGHAEIYLLNSHTAILCRLIIGNPKHRGKGLGQEIVSHILNIAFTQLGVEKTELNVFDWNTSAIKCYEKTGFVINPGKTKKREVKGQTWMALNMSIDKINWHRLKQV
jgi:RimJ/RimL family protein N-acetyltransferase